MFISHGVCEILETAPEEWTEEKSLELLMAMLKPNLLIKILVSSLN